MSFAEVLAAARELTADEQRELARELAGPLPAAFQAWADTRVMLEPMSPVFAPEAAGVLVKLLAEEHTGQ